MTGKERELVDVIMRKKIDIICEQEMEWTRKSTTELEAVIL